MPEMKKMLSGVILAALIILLPLTAAAAGNTKDTKQKPKGPVVIEADELYFSDLNGTIFAKGSVVVTQDLTRMTGDLIRGNSKQNQLWIDDKARWVEPNVDLIGSQVSYNYGTKLGTIAKSTGKIGRDFVVGQKIELFPGQYVIYDGTMTGCPAQIPDYHVSATRVEIWPDDKMIAYNAKFWIKDKVIFSMPKYERSLKDDRSDFPELGYSSDDGAYIRWHLAYPLSNTTSVYFEPAYYSKTGYKPSYGITTSRGNTNVSLITGEFRDVNGYWIKKEPEFNLYTGHQIGSLPWNYSFAAIYGKWTDQYKTSWHQDYDLDFSRHAIPLDQAKSLKLLYGFGFQHIRESYNGQRTNSFNYWVELTKKWNPKLYTWVEYSWIQNNTSISIFDYGSQAVGRALYTGITYKLDKMNSIGYVGTYDLDNHYYYDQDYYWYRDVHCWTLTLEYRAKRKQYIVEFTTKKF